MPHQRSANGIVNLKYKKNIVNIYLVFKTKIFYSLPVIKQEVVTILELEQLLFWWSKDLFTISILY